MNLKIFSFFSILALITFSTTASADNFRAGITAYENGDADEMRRLGGLRNQLINQLSGIQGFALQSANTYDQFATAT